MSGRWDRNLVTGWQSMDAEHWAVLGILAELAVVSDGDGGSLQINAVLHRLRAAVATHFESEEGLMLARNYPMTSSHVAQHALFAKELERLSAAASEAAARSVPSLAGNAGVTGQVVEFVETWFVRHIELADKPLAEFLLSTAPASTRAGGSTASGAPRG